METQKENETQEETYVPKEDEYVQETTVVVSDQAYDVEKTLAEKKVIFDTMKDFDNYLHSSEIENYREINGELI